MQLPTLTTPRLYLTPLSTEQAARLAELGDDPMVRAYTANTPHGRRRSRL